jgi:hypothetical protein
VLVVKIVVQNIDRNWQVEVVVLVLQYQSAGSVPYMCLRLDIFVQVAKGSGI